MCIRDRYSTSSGIQYRNNPAYCADGQYRYVPQKLPGRSTVRKPQNAADNSTAGYPQAFSGRDTGHNPPYHPVPDRISFRGWSGYTQNDGERDGKVTAQYISR